MARGGKGEVALFRYWLLIGALAAPQALWAGGPAPITGRWKTDDGQAIVSIAPCGPKMCGRVERLLIRQPAGGQRDERNPDKAMRSRKIEGLQIYWNLAATGPGWSGEGYSPEHGRYYRALLRADDGKLVMKGCVSIMCRTVTWTRMH